MKTHSKLVSTSVIGLVVAIASARACWAGAAQADMPGKISVPQGWVLQTGHTKDSSRGTITRSDGLAIVYDIGHGAGTRVTRADPARQLWYREQTIRGHTVKLELVKGKDDDMTLAVTFWDGAAVKTNPQTGPANFVVNVKNMQDLADVMTVVLSYEYGTG